MKLVKQLGFAGSMLALAVGFRFITMNSVVDLTTIWLILVSCYCCIGVGIGTWSIFGIFLALSYGIQGFGVTGSYFLNDIISCFLISVVIMVFKLVFKKNMIYGLPIVAGIAKLCLTFFQDLVVLIFNPSMIVYWSSYHIMTEIWAASKVVETVAWSIPVWVGVLLFNRFKNNYIEKSRVKSLVSL